MEQEDRTPQYRENSLSLVGAIALGTGVMIGAGIFALTGQMAEIAGPLFPLAFIAAAVIVGFSAYSYVKMSNAYPSAGGIAMYLEKAAGRRHRRSEHARHSRRRGAVPAAAAQPLTSCARTAMA